MRFRGTAHNFGRRKRINSEADDYSVESMASLALAINRFGSKRGTCFGYV